MDTLVEQVIKYGPSERFQEEILKLQDQLKEAEAEAAAADRAHDFDRFKVDQPYVEKWLFRMRELVRTDPIAAKAKLTSLVGEFTLSPDMIDGVKCLRIESRAKAIGLLKIAGGERFSKEANTGGRI